MNTIRVALVRMKPRLRDILIDVVAREQDMQLIDCPNGADPDLAAVQPDVIVGEIDDPLDLVLPTRLLDSSPRARVLMIADTGDQAALYELRPARKVLPNVSIDQVVEAIRFGIGRHVTGLAVGPDPRPD